MKTKKMVTSAEIKAFDITCGETVQYGYYAALEVVFNKYLIELESYFFDEFNTSLEFSYEILTGLKFNRYLKSIHNPQPIFIFNLSPLIGDCLLIMESRAVNLLLAQNQLNSKRKTGVNNRFSLNTENSSQIQATIEQLLGLFSGCWEKILPVESKLKKLVSNKIKARVMSPAEASVIVRVTLNQNQFSTFWEFCFSDYQLDQVIKKHGSTLLLAGNGEIRENHLIQKHFSDLLLQESNYQLKGVLGELLISEQMLLDSYHDQAVIPIINDISKNVVVTVNEKPLLSAVAGVTNDQIALQINGKYEKKKVEERVRQKPFHELKFPTT
ncbi:MAG: hypothetical protein HQ517_15730 [SAR324 cluster bacterium]|nr:hypothetical protein [SAR324 cluster bacterium]